MKNRKKKKKNKKLLKIKIALIGLGVLLIAFFIIFIISVIAAMFTAANHEEPKGNTSTAENYANEEGNLDDLPVSKNLVKFIESWEGYAANGYRGLDNWNVTIGYGHVIQSGETYSNLSKDDAEKLLVNDLKNGGYVKFIQKEFGDCNLSQSQFDALVSLCYNIGTGNWNNLNLTKDVKRGADADTIRTDFEAICHVGGVKSEGLLRRRFAEWDMYESGYYALNN